MGEHRGGRDRVLVVNAGSSSLKLRVLDGEDRVVTTLDTAPARDDGSAAGLAAVIDRLGRVDAVGHRVVHGGAEFRAPILVDDHAERALRRLTPLAPLHQPAALAALHAARLALPDAPHVACFDTAFHSTLPPAARTYPLPAGWREEYGLHRYGFHGLSHQYAAERVSELIQDVAPLRLVVAHLGAGSSLSAVLDGECRDTTMGFTPLEGNLVMATRSGTVDPGMLLWLQQQAGIGVEEIADVLEERSGLRGLAGSADMAEVVADAEDGDPDASLALEVYAHRLRASIAAMTTAIGGMDVLVFTGGVGEHVPRIRRDAAIGLRHLGLAVDRSANAAATSVEDVADVTGAGSRVRCLVLAAREDRLIARDVRNLVA